jgi:hypothetical protein
LDRGYAGSWIWASEKTSYSSWVNKGAVHRWA